ncbi:MAG: bifunctional alpha/beta hydrolase/OsmC family protein [Wenzhouxiangellaceae bacterium]
MSRVQFTNRQGLQLTGDIEWPAGGEASAFALFAHCFTCTRNLKAAINICQALAAEGIAVMRFDFTGLGQSQGDFSEADFSANISDLEDAAAFLARAYQPPQLLIGHSLGGTAALAAAARIDSCRAVVSINAPADPEHVLNQMEPSLETIEKEGSAEVRLGGRPFRIARKFVDDVRQFDLLSGLNQMRRALLVMHTPVDTVVSVSNAQQIFSHASHPKSYISLDDADHLLSDPADSAYVGRQIVTWVQRYLQPAAPLETAGVSASGRTDAGFLTLLRSGHHQWLADEPESYGGSDRGPGPYELLAGALAACTSMTLNMYARHKKLPVVRVHCEVEHQRIHAQDCADCASQEGKVDVLTRRIRIEGELSTEQHQRMLEIADRCPVHKTLSREIKIRTEGAT